MERDALQPDHLAPRVDWHEAPAHIGALIQRAGHGSRRPVLVGIAGPVASGKSSLARRLSDCIVSTDDYLPDYHAIPEHERDEPRHADLSRLARDLESLRSGRDTAVPVWSFHSHSRTGERTITPAEVIVCEGIHALHNLLAHLYDLAIFVEAPRDVRLARMEDRERSGARGWGVEKSRAYFAGVAEPTFERFEADYRSQAGLIVRNARHVVE